MVEHLTLNQGVQGSSPWRCTKHGPLVKWPKTPASHAGNSGSNPLRVTTVGADDGEGTPVPIPNTAVKLTRAENTWLEAAREDRAMLSQTPDFYSPV